MPDTYICMSCGDEFTNFGPGEEDGDGPEMVHMWVCYECRRKEGRKEMNERKLMDAMMIDLKVKYRICRECHRAYKDGEPGSACDVLICGKCYPWMQREERREAADG